MNTIKNKSYISIRLFIFALLIIALSCNGHKKVILEFKEHVLALQDAYIKDKSLSIFTADLDHNNGYWILEGETTNSIIYSNLIRYTDSLLTKEK